LRNLIIRTRQVLLKVVVASLTTYIATSSVVTFGGIYAVLLLVALLITSLVLSVKRSLPLTIAVSTVTYLLRYSDIPQALLIASLPILSRGYSRLKYYLFITYSIALMYYSTYYVGNALTTIVACITVATSLLLITYEGVLSMGSQEGIAKLVFKASLIALLAYVISWLSPVIPTVIVFGSSAIAFLLAIDKIAKYVK